MTVELESANSMFERVQRLGRLRQLDNESHWRSVRTALAASPELFFNDWVFTFDPRVKPAVMPMVLFEKQAEFVDWLRKRIAAEEDGLVEKSRDMGVTWLCMGFAIWLWLFHPGNKISFGSRKESLVDRAGDPDSIFEKGRMLIQWLPRELLPKDFDAKKHLTFMRFINPDNGNAITGEAGDNIGRGGRNTVYFIDEAAFLERPDRVEASLAANTNVRIYVSTPNGEANPFYRKRMSGEIPVFSFHWRDDPRKDDAWYAEQKRKLLDARIVAQEIDIDYSASKTGRIVLAEWINAAIDFPLTAVGAKRGALDVADEGGDANVLVLGHGPKIEKIDAWYEGHTTQTGRKAIVQGRMYGAEWVTYDGIGVGSGVKSAGKDAKDDDQDYLKAFIASESPSNSEFEETGKKCSDLFKNLRAEMCWKLRRRFEKTWLVANGLAEFPEDELISIPNDAQLKMELGALSWETTESGLIKIESKEKLTIPSPNYFDALVMYFYVPAQDYADVKLGSLSKTSLFRAGGM